MGECSICGLPMLHDGVVYHDGQLVACADGHVAMVSHDAESEPYVGDADTASEWVRHLSDAFHASSTRRADIRVIASAVDALEKQAAEVERLRADLAAADERERGRAIIGWDSARGEWYTIPRSVISEENAPAAIGIAEFFRELRLWWSEGMARDVIAQAERVIADNDSLRAENARLWEAMPSDEEREAYARIVSDYATKHMAGISASARITTACDWLARVDAARAAKGGE